jgi:hypothetical protein
MALPLPGSLLRKRNKKIIFILHTKLKTYNDLLAYLLKTIKKRIKNNNNMKIKQINQ